MNTPLPKLTPENTAFWTGGVSGRLLIMRCSDCDYRIHPPQLVCPSCLSEQIEPIEASGQGHVYSYTVNRQAWMPGLPVPYIIAVIELDDQPSVRLTARIVGSPPEAITVGAPVQVDFELKEEIAIPVFRLKS